MNSLWKSLSNIVSKTTSSPIHNESFLYTPLRTATLWTMHRRNVEFPDRLAKKEVLKKKNKPLEGKPMAKGIILKTLIKNPRKPNSANRKCVLVKLSTGKEMVAYVPGVGHNLQEHQTVLCRAGKLKDVPGVKIKCIRGKYDLPHVKAKQ